MLEGGELLAWLHAAFALLTMSSWFGADDEADRLWAVALVLLLNNLMAQLATRGNCTPLLHLRFAVPPDACTALQVRPGAGAAASTRRGPGAIASTV